jgi:hypothetical protein
MLLMLASLAQAPDSAKVEHDTVGLGRTLRTAREALGRMPDVWRVDADSVTWLFHRGDSAWATERRRGRDWLVPLALSAGAPRANMSFELDGKRYAMVVLPLSGTEDERARLLVHEATHTFQPLILPGRGATEPMDGGDFLDDERGRTWLFMELRAIARALTARGDARREAARDALLFRNLRDSLASPVERGRLDSLDINEGVPSYTAWRLTLAEPATLAARLDSAPDLPMSWVRGIAYETGPAYGYLLDLLAGDAWRPAWLAGERLPAILSTVLGSEPFTHEINARAGLYGYESVRNVEHARTRANLRRIDSLVARFVTGPTLRLVPGSLRVTFDPNRQQPIGTSGTVMMNFRWSSEQGGELVAEGGALVSPNWTSIQVPLGDATLETGPLTEPLLLEGDGWRLSLPAGWRVSRSGNRVTVMAPRP